MCYVACVETLKCETVLNGEKLFFIKVIFSYATMSQKNFKTRKSEYIIYKRVQK